MSELRKQMIRDMQLRNSSATTQRGYLRAVAGLAKYYRRSPDTRGWWCGWYESGKRKAKALPSKAMAEHYRQIKYAQLNSDVFTGTINVDWSQMREEHMHYKKVKGDQQATLYETALTLRHFERLIGTLGMKRSPDMDPWR